MVCLDRPSLIVELATQARAGSRRPYSIRDFTLHKYGDNETRELGNRAMPNTANLAQTRKALLDLIALLKRENMDDLLPGFYHLVQRLEKEELDIDETRQPKAYMHSLYGHKESIAFAQIWKDTLDERIVANKELSHMGERLRVLVESL